MIQTWNNMLEFAGSLAMVRPGSIKKCLERAELKYMYCKADQSVLHEDELNHALTAASHEAGLQTPVRLADTSALHELPLQQAGLH